MTRPNVLVIVADCARSDRWLAPDRQTRTPNVDRLAARGVALPTTIVEKSCTTPSFSTLLTGRYSPRHGVHLVWGYRLPASVPLLPEQFAAHGYNTYAEVSGPLLPEMGLARGFQEYEYRAPCDHLHTAWGERFRARLRNGHYKPPFFLLLHVWELHPHRYVAPAFNSAEFGRDEYERAISSLDQQLGTLLTDVPETTLIAFTGDHGEKTRFETYRPNTAVDYARRMLRVDEADGMAPFQIAAWAGPSVLQEMYGRAAPRMRQMRVRDWQPPQFGAWQRLRDRLRLLRLTPFVYLHDLLSLGTPLKLTQMLRRRGLLSAERARTKVNRFSASADQAALLDMHMRMWINSYKRNMDEGHMVHVYDYLVKVPLVLHWHGANAPAALRPRRIDRMLRQPDVLPTLMELCGLEPPTDGDGRSFHDLLTDRAWQPRPAFLSVSGLPMDLEIRGVRTETHKYTFGPHNPELPEELYDLRTDPGETANIVADSASMRDELRALANSFVDENAVEPLDEMAADAQVAGRLRELGYIE